MRMPSNFPENVVEGVAVGNLKSIAEQPAMLSNLAFANVAFSNNLAQQNAVANQQAMNETGVAATSKAVKAVASIGPLEARSAVDVLTNDEIAQTIADLKATVAAFVSQGGGPSGQGGTPVVPLVPPGSRGNPLTGGYFWARPPVSFYVEGVDDPNQIEVNRGFDESGNAVVSLSLKR
jgi:hypothetical protein